MLFALISLAALLLFVVAPVVAVALARRRWRTGDRRSAALALAVALVLLAVGVEAFVVEPRALEVSHVEITSAKIDRPLTIAVLADIQTDDPGDYEREVLARVVAEDPDLIVFPGDYVQVPESRYAEPAARLRAILAEAGREPAVGADAVAGHNEFGHPDWPRVFAGTGIEAWTEGRRVDLGPLTLTGLSVAESFDPGLAVAAAPNFHVVVGHAPDFSLGEVEADLMIAGHTHGGQVRLPWIGPLITYSQVPRAHAAGHTELGGGRSLVVSRGIGMERAWAPRMRFLCRPELVFIHLRPAG